MLGATEVAVILLVIVLIFGPSKLPQLGTGLGQMLRGFRSGMREVERPELAGDDG